MKKAAIYCRPSTPDPECSRQVIELAIFARDAGYDVQAVFTEAKLAAKGEMVERNKLMTLAQDKAVDTILVTEISRWGRSTIDLLTTLSALSRSEVNIVAARGFQLDLATQEGRILAGLLSPLVELERELIAERKQFSALGAKRRRRVVDRKLGNSRLKRRKRGSQSINSRRSQV